MFTVFVTRGVPADGGSWFLESPTQPSRLSKKRWKPLRRAFPNSELILGNECHSECLRQRGRIADSFTWLPTATFDVTIRCSPAYD